MRLRNDHVGLWIALALAVATGCSPSQPFYLFDDGDMSHYKGVATEIEYPDVKADTLSEVDGALPPLTLDNSEAREIWELPLEEAIQLGLANSKAMRTIGGTVVRTPTQLTNAPAAIQTVYEPAIVESDPRVGVEGALSAFDTNFSTSVFWEKNDRPVNLSFPGFIARVLEQDTGAFTAQLAKTAATGTQFAMRNNTNYEWNNNPSNLYPSAWVTQLEAEFNHPLLQGSGVAFNRIAGPSGIPGVNGFRGIPGSYNGVAIARINTDIAIADFEAGVRDVVSEIELSYWELYFAYRNLDALIVGRDSALQTWRTVYALYVNGAKGGEADKEAQAREQYYLFRGQVESALSTLYDYENRLRYMIGLSATDGRLIRPADDPTTARVKFDWYEVHLDALVRTAELRRQKWVIKQRQLELEASKNFLLPRLDAIGRYRFYGFGNDLLGNSGNAPNGNPFPNAWETLTDGNFQEWQMGLQASIPIGFRQALAGVRNAELRLARERAVLQDQELEVSHQMANAIRELDRTYVLTQTNFNRRNAAQRNVDAVFETFQANVITLDLLLDAQRRLAVAESDYYRSLVDYNLAVRQVHLIAGTLLEYNGVFLAEGPWPGKAYFDARKRARERDAGLFLNYGFTRPNVFSRGPMPQNPGGEHQGVQADTSAAPRASGQSSPGGEVVPTPTPTTNGPATTPSATPRTGGGAMRAAPVQAADEAGPALLSPEAPRQRRSPLSYNWGSLNQPDARPASFDEPAAAQPSAPTARTTAVRPVASYQVAPEPQQRHAAFEDHAPNRANWAAANGQGAQRGGARP